MHGISSGCIGNLLLSKHSLALGRVVSRVGKIALGSLLLVQYYLARPACLPGGLYIGLYILPVFFSLFIFLVVDL